MANGLSSIVCSISYGPLAIINPKSQIYHASQLSTSHSHPPAILSGARRFALAAVLHSGQSRDDEPGHLLNLVYQNKFSYKNIRKAGCSSSLSYCYLIVLPHCNYC
jgi:predicted short-subunit dehydrogenase-like oxidoreductase (DUF2520 family)